MAKLHTPVNSVGTDALVWIFQQDYMTFLAALGWVSAGLVAWGSTGGNEPRGVPWKWFAFFCLFLALDATLDLAKMVAVDLWPPQLDGILRLAAYAYLLEFARRAAVQHEWVRLPPFAAMVIPLAAQAIATFAPQASALSAITVAYVAGICGATILVSTLPPQRSRPLLGVAAALVLLGPWETLRSQGGVAIDGLYGLLVTGEGFASALTAGLLAWVTTGGLWLTRVLRRQSGILADTSAVATFLLPVVLLATLVGGYFVVNWSSESVRDSIERDYLSRVRTAALSIDSELLLEAERDAAIGNETAETIGRMKSRIRSIAATSDDVLQVYLWNVVGGRILVRPEWISGTGIGRDDTSIVGVGVRVLPATGQAHLIGPLGTREATVMIASAPIRAPDGEHRAWLGIDLSASQLLHGQAVARLQAIAMVGLFATLVVFFLAHVLLREQEAELIIARQRAEAADRAKDEFLAVMSHELRTPMQSVLGYSELMAQTRLSEPQANYLDTIRSQGKTLLRVVQDILDFSTLKKSSYTLKKEVVYLHRLVENVFESIRPLAERKRLVSRYSIGPDVPEVVMGDAVRIEQILRNLMGNGVKFTDHGSVEMEVTLESSGSDGKSAGSHLVRFAIKDTGLGIRERDQQRLFEPFTRLSYGEHTRREGTGLGLAIVKRLCELMGGSIAIESQWGRGTTFFVRLPFEPATDLDGIEAGTGDRRSDEPPAELVNLAEVLPLRILVADDNPFIQRLMVEYLRSIGYEPVPVGHGAEAVDRWREFDVLIMDLRMPVMDGMTAAAHIRDASGSTTEPWMIGVSATLAESEISKAIESGMNDFLGKPFFVQGLIEALMASPFYERRTGEPRSRGTIPPAAEPVDDHHPPIDTAPSGSRMNWMPDLGSTGDDELVEQAVAEIPGLLDEIQHALDRGDVEVAAERAHYLKNTIYALNIEPMTAPCLAVFERSRSNDAPAASEFMKTLRTGFLSWKTQRDARMAADGTH